MFNNAYMLITVGNGRDNAINHIFQKLIASVAKELSIVDANMIRFWMTFKDGIEYNLDKNDKWSDKRELLKIVETL